MTSKDNGGLRSTNLKLMNKLITVNQMFERNVIKSFVQLRSEF